MNLAARAEVAVIDRRALRIVARWTLVGARASDPACLDEDTKRIQATKDPLHSLTKSMPEMVDEGVRLFDCADSYGSLPMVAKALKGKPRESYVLVSKVWCHPKGGIPDDESRDDSMAVIERFLREVACQADSRHVGEHQMVVRPSGRQ